MTLRVGQDVIREQHQVDGKEETSQTSDDAEWDDTILEEQTRAEPNEKLTLYTQLARPETQT